MARLLGVVLVSLSLAAFADDAVIRLGSERAALRETLLRSCPEQKSDIEQLGSAAATVETFRKLDACGGNNEAFLVQYGSALNNADRFVDAEVVFRRAMNVRITEAAQVGLLVALSRQAKLTAAQQQDVATNIAYFKKRPCFRDDLCAALAYAAWHLLDKPLAKLSAERAMTFGYKGWQPWFVAGTIEAGGDDKARAISLLNEAKKRGGPAKDIDGFLEKLGK